MVLVTAFAVEMNAAVNKFPSVSSTTYIAHLMLSECVNIQASITFVSSYNLIKFTIVLCFPY